MTQINLSKSAMATIAACVIGTAGSVAWFGIHRVPSVKVSVEIDPNSNNKTQTVPNPIFPTQPPIVSSQPPKDNRVAIYQTEPTQNGFKTVPKNLPLPEPTQSAEDNLRAAFGELLAGNKSGAKASKASAVSTIPVGTKLLALKTESDGIHINLSSEFESGGGSTSMQARLAQVLFTATSLEPNANVWISIAGKKLEVLGGEGLEVPYPLTRKAFQTEFESQQQS
jgi:Sporulation and spore germination